ncbi:MAG: D-alanine--D-alanine ligase family protein [Halothermotrichaceae bacterium]
MSRLKVGLLFGGRSEEHEVSIMSARAIYSAADSGKYQIKPYAISKNGYWLDQKSSMEILEDKKIRCVDADESGTIAMSLEPFLKENLDLVFPVLHGPYGEDGKMQGFLEMLDIPYVGAGVLSSAAGMDKAVMKKLFSYSNIPQGNYTLLNKYGEDDKNKVIEKINNDIGWPCFIKPANMGSSIGISKVNKAEELNQALKKAYQHDYKVIIEEYIKGREVESSVLGNKKIIASLPGEIINSHEFYDYEAKYQDKTTELIIPAKLDRYLTEDIKDKAIKSFKAIDGRGFARVDFFIRDKDNKIFVNEINTIPGFTQYSMYAKLWEVTGIKYNILIDKLIELALEWQSI